MGNHIAEDFTAALLAMREFEGTNRELADPAASRIERLTDLVLRVLDWTPPPRRDVHESLAPIERLAA